MTDYSKMEAGRGLDALVAEKVMGWAMVKGQLGVGARATNKHGNLRGVLTERVPAYSTTWEGMGLVVGELASQWLHMDVCSTPDEHPTAYVCVVRDPSKHSFREWRAEADTAPHAVALAALRAVERL